MASCTTAIGWYVAVLARSQWGGSTVARPLAYHPFGRDRSETLRLLGLKADRVVIACMEMYYTVVI